MGKNNVSRAFLLTSLVFGLCVIRAHAQDQTRSFSQNSQLTQASRITIVPFEPRMIISDLHRDMCVKNEMNSQQLREALAAAFCYAMRNTAPELLEAEVIGWDDAWPAELENLYRELGYRNTPIEDYVGAGGTSVEEGQLRTRYDTLTKYMQPVVKPKVVASLAGETTADYVLLISQIDLVNLGESVRVAPDASRFYVRVHYALFNPQGDLVKGGLISTKLENQSYIPSKIAKNEFKVLSALLYADVGQFLNQFQSVETEQTREPDQK
jgi:hypothetical protein